MGIERITLSTLAGLTLWAGLGLAAQAQPPAVTVEDAIRRMPRQPGVEVSTPTPAQLPQCKVDAPPKGRDPKTPLVYVVRDPAGNPVRQFVSYDNKSFNIVAFYVNGVEAFREVYPPAPNEPHQFRWLGSNGTKWGLDRDRDGKIDEWVVLSPEELSQELFQAVLTKDPKRAEALTVTKANLDQLGLRRPRQKLLAGAGVPEDARSRGGAKLSPDAKWANIQPARPRRHRPIRSTRDSRRSGPSQARHAADSGRKGRQGDQDAPDRRTDPDRPGVETWSMVPAAAETTPAPPVR